MRPLSHSRDAIETLQAFCAAFKSTAERISVWNSENALVRKPIEPEEAVRLGFGDPEDRFVLLQGDVVRTDSAYNFGVRITGLPKYAVLNSSCDLIPGRSSSSLLLPIADIRRNDPEAKGKIGTLAKFGRFDSMYLPPLPDDPLDVIGSEIQFDGVCQIRTPDLWLATRAASLSLLGWRIFASFSRTVLARANPREVELRTAFEPRDST